MIFQNAKNKSTPKLSEQFLVDCSNGYIFEGLGAYGCSGAWPSTLLAYLIENYEGKVFLEDYYPYTAETGDCKQPINGIYENGRVIDYISKMPSNEYELMKLLVNYGPVATSIDATGYYSYESGVFDDNEKCCNTVTDGPNCG